MNISQSLNTITNSGTILGSIKNCFDTNGNLKEGVCSVGNWYGQPIIDQKMQGVNIKAFNNIFVCDFINHDYFLLEDSICSCITA